MGSKPEVIAKTNGNVAGEARVERDERGRFKPGHPYKSPGRPKGKALKSYVETWEANCDQQSFADICAAVVAKAKAGNLQAVKLVFDKLLSDAETRLHFSGQSELRLAGISVEAMDEQMQAHLASETERLKRLKRYAETRRPEDHPDYERLYGSSRETDMETNAGAAIPASFE